MRGCDVFPSSAISGENLHTATQRQDVTSFHSVNERMRCARHIGCGIAVTPDILSPVPSLQGKSLRFSSCCAWRLAVSSVLMVHTHAHAWSRIGSVWPVSEADLGASLQKIAFQKWTRKVTAWLKTIQEWESKVKLTEKKIKGGWGWGQFSVLSFPTI